MAVQDQPRFLTIKDVAAELATSESQIRALLSSGDLPAIQIGGRGQWRIERAKFEDYIADAYTRTVEALKRGMDVSTEDED
ncbi:helix-turn-helix domain-containing protein [Arthrobacter tumbae]|uniref:helix-turn-helix domain-containing protein n=1 Tax=Arthrobacter tumbae TaxID=163874 RepID=UPI00195E1392|nr:helix-turn-helix domain-containing protein [Arthrobacter tumbae]MBM7782243.1 excisionase family DNA binding protein [Arthrobacter tumbae]